MKLDEILYKYNQKIEIYNKCKLWQNDAYSACINNMSYDEIKTGFIIELRNDLKQYQESLSVIELIQDININIDTYKYQFQINFYMNKECNLSIIDLTNSKYLSIKDNGKTYDILLDKPKASVKDIANIISDYGKIKHCIKSRIEEQLIKQLKIIEDNILQYSIEQDIYDSIISNYDEIKTITHDIDNNEEYDDLDL